MELCVALDLDNNSAIKNLIKELKEFDIWLKVGFRTFIRDGKSIIDFIKDTNPNFKIFLDLKLYDIPNTMADAASEIAKLDIDMFNIHASSGKEAMEAVVNKIKYIDKKPLILSVTALTSFDNSSFKYIYNDDIKNKAIQFAKDSYDAGVDGVVCSVYESNIIKQTTSINFLTLTPGIRPFGEEDGDQKRVATVELAKKNLADFIVVGRPIYKNNNPKAIIEQILTQINS